jgi:hypothetical protein
MPNFGRSLGDNEWNDGDRKAKMKTTAVVFFRLETRRQNTAGVDEHKWFFRSPDTLTTATRCKSGYSISVEFCIRRTERIDMAVLLNAEKHAVRGSIIGCRTVSQSFRQLDSAAAHL